MTGNPIQPVTPEQKIEWNNFLDFLQKKGFAGNPVLDDRSMKLGQGLMEQYNKLNPKSAITYADVPAIQAELQKYRGDLVQKWKAGKATSDVKDESEIMPGLSKIDGWLGSKTSSYKFPTAVITHADGDKTDFGIRTDLYDKAIAAKTVLDNKVTDARNK